MIVQPQTHGTMAARQHHYIPRFFLEGFTDRDGFVHVFDLETARRWKARPEQIARERDFYRVENPDLQPNVVEDGLSQIEHELAPAVVRLLENRAFPGQDEEDFTRIANLIAMLGARVPGAIKAFANPFAKIGERLMQRLLETRDHYEAHLEERRASGEDISGAPTWEQMKEAFESGAIKVETSQDYRIAIMLQSMNIILPCLSGRNWGLLCVSDILGTGPLVCSDRPVTLTWTEKVPAFYSPGWGTTSTELLLPVSGDLAILSAFESVPDRVEGDAVRVAVSNTRALRQAERFVFSPRPRFQVLGAGRQLIDSDTVLENRRTAIATGEEGETSSAPS